MSATVLDGTVVERFDLYCKENGSNKIYRGRLVEVEGGWVVNCIYHGATKPPTVATKTKEPVDEATARKIYLALYKEKMSPKKGYRSLDGNTEADPVYQKLSGRKMIGYGLQFPTSITPIQAESFLEDDAFMMQVKENGEYRTLNKVTHDDGTVEIFGGNSSAEQIPLQQHIVDALAAHPARQLAIHGEDMGAYIVAFDLTRDDTGDLMGLGGELRYSKLLRLVPDFPFLRLVECAIGVADKRALLGRVIDANLEGVVFKNREFAYAPGKASNVRKATSLKYKLKEQCFCVVTSHTKGKHSVQACVFDADMNPVDVGSVTIPQKQDLPAIGSTIEVEYLYVTREGGSLKESAFKGERIDVGLPKCGVDQLKYHAQGATS